MIDFFVKGGFMMVPMLFVSIAAVAFMIERGLALKREKILPQVVLEKLQLYQTTGNLTELQKCCQSNASPLERLINCALAHRRESKKENQDAIENQARKEVVLLERWLVFLEIIVGIAPLMGMITLFGGLGANFGAADPALIAAGISVTLNVTFTGLAIAVPSLVAWSYYCRRVEVLTMELETSLSELIQKMYQDQK